jgi:hypothetical protein
MLSQRVGRTFAFGPSRESPAVSSGSGGAGGGNITSPLFGQANQPAGSGGGIFPENANNRRLELQMRFTF